MLPCQDKVRELFIRADVRIGKLVRLRVLPLILRLVLHVEPTDCAGSLPDSTLGEEDKADLGLNFTVALAVLAASFHRVHHHEL